MPSVSEKQQRFMAAVAHNPAFAREASISQSVAEEFNAADEAKDAARHETRKRMINVLMGRR